MGHSTIVIILIWFGITQAQVNTEKYRTPADLYGLSGFLEISGTIKTGNAEKTEGEIESRVDWKTKTMMTFFIFKSEYEWVDGKRFSNEGLFHIRNVIGLTENISSELFAQINYDKNVFLNDRELLGAGIRYKFLQLENFILAMGSAYMFEHEKYDLGSDSSHPDEVNVSRWSNYISIFYQHNEAVSFSGAVYAQPMFDRFSDHRILNESSLTVNLSKILSLSINFRMRYDSDPPDDIEETDTKTDLGLALKW